MTDITIGNPGVAGSSTEAFTQYDVLLSDTPSLFTETLTVADGQTLSLYQVVGFDGSGNIVDANNGTTGTPITAIGIMAAAITTSGATAKAQVYRGGHFNMDALVWNAAYATDADKEAAFRGADTPTQILIGSNPYHRKP